MKNEMPRLFQQAIGTELTQIGPQVFGLGQIPDAGNGFSRAGNLGLGIADIFNKIGFVPGEGTVLVGV
jgi:hypothetical protein